MSLLATQRKEKILDFLKEDGYAKVTDLADFFQVTEVTIRQDLIKLEAEGLVIREHGGASLQGLGNQTDSLPLVNQKNLPAKKAIAKEALNYINDGDCIILDSGSTTTEIARAIKGKRKLTVITNALNIAIILGNEPDIETVVTGGELKSPTLSLTGNKAADFFKGLHADKLFLATGGVSLDKGLTYPSISNIVVKEVMLNATAHVYLVADSSKLGKTAFASLGPLSLVNHWITDSELSSKR